MPCACASRVMTNTETRYAHIEKKASKLMQFLEFQTLELGFAAGSRQEAGGRSQARFQTDPYYYHYQSNNRS